MIGWEHYEVLICGSEADTEISLGPESGTETQAATDPTVDNDAASGYSVGTQWVNTTSGEVFVLTDATTGAAVWTSTTTSAPPAAVAVSYDPATSGMMATDLQAAIDELKTEIVALQTVAGRLGAGGWS